MTRTPIPGSPRFKEIEAAVQSRFDQSLRTSSRDAYIVMGRQIAWYLARKLTRFSLPQIGRFFSGKHHTTVLYGVRGIEMRIASEPAFAQFVAGIESDIQHRIEERPAQTAARFIQRASLTAAFEDRLSDRIAQKLIDKIRANPGILAGLAVPPGFAKTPSYKSVAKDSAGAETLSGAGGFSVLERGAA